MKGLDSGVELLKYEKGADGYIYCEMAVNGVKVGTFSFPVTHLDMPNLATEPQLAAFLSRQAKTMLTRYGANGNRPEATESDLLSTVA